MADDHITPAEITATLTHARATDADILLRLDFATDSMPVVTRICSANVR
jgi:hypothetical protein